MQAELQAHSGGFAYFMCEINVLGPGDLSADLTIVQNDKCIDSFGALLCSYIRSLFMAGAEYEYKSEFVGAKRSSNGERRLCTTGRRGEKGKLLEREALFEHCSLVGAFL